MVWTSLVRGRYKESLQVGEKDVAAAVQVSGDEKLQVEAFEYKMRPIVEAAGAHLEFERIAEVRLKGFTESTEIFLARQADE